MNKTGLRSRYVSNAGLAFKRVCLHLLEKAFCAVKTKGRVDKDWTENAISEALKKSIYDDDEAIQMQITPEVEVRQLPDDLSAMPSVVDDATRIDIKIGGFDTGAVASRVCYYMEAKNLYGKNFKKTGGTNTVSATAYAKRYISTGIDHLLSGYYPANTILLGYVLVGTIRTAVDKINLNLVKKSRGSESITLPVCAEDTDFMFGGSAHPNGMALEHCFLQF